LRRTYRYRIYPTRHQAATLDEQLGFACDLYNAALEQRRDSWRRGQPIGQYDQSSQLTAVRREGLSPEQMNAWSQGDVLARLDKAFAGFFRRVAAGDVPGYPRFRSKARYDSLTWQLEGKGGGCAIVDRRLRLQGVGHVKVHWHREIPAEATIKTVTVKRQAGRWYVCLSLDGVAPKPAPKTGKAVGLDLGISTFAALSTGELIDGPRAHRAAAPSVRRAQRKVARRKRGSNRHRKAVALLARQRAAESNRRRDHAHKTARSLVDRYDTICVEDLNTRGLAAGMLARDVNDQGWGLFVSLLTEKAEEAARELILVDPKYTSQACSACGTIVPKALSVRVHSCSCGYTADRDVNAARNVLARGLGCSLQAPTVGDEALAVA
jgi:putative transposase